MNKIRWIAWFEIILGLITIPYLFYFVLTTDQSFFIPIAIGVFTLAQILAGGLILTGYQIGRTISILIQSLQLPYLYVKDFLYNIGIGTQWGLYLENYDPTVDITFVGFAFNVSYDPSFSDSSKWGINLIALILLWNLIKYREEKLDLIQLACKGSN